MPPQRRNAGFVPPVSCIDGAGLRAPARDRKGRLRAEIGATDAPRQQATHFPAFGKNPKRCGSTARSEKPVVSRPGQVAVKCEPATFLPCPLAAWFALSLASHNRR